MTDDQLYTLIGYILLAHSFSTERLWGSLILAVTGFLILMIN